MSVLPRQKNNAECFFTPMRVGFLCSLILHIAVALCFVDFVRQSVVEENGMNEVMLSLATIQNPSNEDSHEPKPKPRRHHKPKPRPHHTANPIQEHIQQEESSQSTRAAQANQQNEGDVIETLTYHEGEHNELYSQIRREINKKQKHPPMMVKRRLEDEVLVEFVIYTDGKVTNIRVVRPSKHDDFNRYAIKAIKDASKHFPRVTKNLRLEIPLEYKLKRL